MSVSPNPSGLCMCGCGERTPLATRTNRARGLVAGEPRRFCTGHKPLIPLAERLWAKVRKLPGDDACWEFTGTRNWAGYGQIGRSAFRGDRRLAMTHRVAWETSNGPIPEGLEVCHRCDNPSCVRPDHLFLGTHRENMRDMGDKGRASLPDNHGSRNPRAVSRAVALHAVELLNDGARTSEIIRRTGLSKPTVCKMRRGDHWIFSEVAA